MKVKTYLIVVLTILITVILMKNTEEVNFWFFGDYSFSKLSVLLAFFVLGMLFGAILFRSRRPKAAEAPLDSYIEVPSDSDLTEEDRHFLN